MTHTGCKNFHIRPAGNPWDKLDDAGFAAFTDDDIELFNEQVRMARDLEDETFGVYGITHKFSETMDRNNVFRRCHAIFMTAVFMPGDNEGDEDEFIMGLCCDRRGDEKIELKRNMRSVEEINELWGSERHWEIFDSIDVPNECPRCTYQPHNQIYEHVIKERQHDVQVHMRVGKWLMRMNWNTSNPNCRPRRLDTKRSLEELGFVGKTP